MSEEDKEIKLNNYLFDCLYQILFSILSEPSAPVASFTRFEITYGVTRATVGNSLVPILKSADHKLPPSRTALLICVFEILCQNLCHFVSL